MAKSTPTLVTLQERWAIAAAKAQAGGRGQQAAIKTMGRVVEAIGQHHRRELPAYQRAYQRALEQAHGIRLPRQRPATKAPSKKRPATKKAPTKKRAKPATKKPATKRPAKRATKRR